MIEPTITCPNCATESKLTESLAAPIIQATRREYEAKIAQKEEDATFAPKLAKEDGKIDWNLDTRAILNRIRGLTPWPGTYSDLEGHTLKIISAEAISDKAFSRFSPGEVVVADEKKGLVIKTGNGAISISELQLEGKKRMRAELFLRGYKIDVGTKLV